MFADCVVGVWFVGAVLRMCVAACRHVRGGFRRRHGVRRLVRRTGGNKRLGQKSQQYDYKREFPAFVQIQSSRPFKRMVIASDG